MSKIEHQIEIVETRLNEITAINRQITELNSQITNINADIRSWQNSIKTLNEEIKSIQNNTVAIDNGNEDIDEYKKNLKITKTQKEDLIYHKNILEVSSVLLKDTGIKTKIIKQYIPIMNKLINKYLAAMDFFVQFELDESFNETIKC